MTPQPQRCPQPGSATQQEAGAAESFADGRACRPGDLPAPKLRQRTRRRRIPRHTAQQLRRAHRTVRADGCTRPAGHIDDDLRWREPARAERAVRPGRRATQPAGAGLPRLPVDRRAAIRVGGHPRTVVATRRCHAPVRRSLRSRCGYAGATLYPCVHLAMAEAGSLRSLASYVELPRASPVTSPLTRLSPSSLPITRPWANSSRIACAASSAAGSTAWSATRPVAMPTRVSALREPPRCRRHSLRPARSRSKTSVTPTWVGRRPPSPARRSRLRRVRRSGPAAPGRVGWPGTAQCVRSARR